MFTDNAIVGWLLIVIATAFLTIAALEEVLAGTENKLVRTKFMNASKTHLFVESTFMVYSVLQFAHIIGPITGGLINTDYTMARTCTIMGLLGITATTFYFVFAIWVHLTIDDNTLSLTSSLRELDLDIAEPMDVEFV